MQPPEQKLNHTRILTADEGAQSHVSGGRVHAWPCHACARSREPAGFRSENPQGFGIDERRYAYSKADGRGDIFSGLV